MVSKSKGTSRQLRQTTLSESPKTSRASSSKTSSPTQLKRNRKTLVSQTNTGSDDDDDRGLSSIKFAQKKSSHSSDGDSVAHTAKRRKTIIIDSDDSEHVVRTRKPRKKKTHSRHSDADDAAEQPRRRKLKKKRDVALVSSTDDEELAEEVEKERIIECRFRNRNKKTAFQKNLEKLKRRKEGKPSESSSSSSNEGNASSDDDDVPFKGAKPSSDFDSLFDEDSEVNSSDFIVEDDNSVIATLPMEFSMESHEDLDHQFKKIFQFFVHIAVRPAKERHYFMEDQLYREQYFSTPLRTVRRKLSGLRDSLVVSSVWRPGFKKGLATYPIFNLVPLDFAVPSCDACHLGGRMSTLIGRLSGSPYDPLGFEFKDKENSSSSDPDGDHHDETISENERSAVEFHLGRFCARRTRVYHEFTHWEYALFKCIRDEVDELHENRQSRGFFRIAYAGGIEPPEDLDDADGICEWLDQRKVIDVEWMKIKDMMESARHLELDRKKGDDD
ncbi:hypothetical protein E4T56_gene19393 [Termitomyces sp. T112]|nr:hypothetical protein C0989_008720 [Termitomyces sp. Mn162]KAG5728034.1 hypothetical protein E4T56_gene19393 [Termitomyces sp. T112]KAH0583845.1 hypothetical protein H2248_009443 [Termitomyces sp. 'cryptogamus']KNZ71776.1 hypothetical protein J132_07265 [Termitomyces sp. J132]